MKIGMNALFYRFPSTGSGQYMTHLLKALAEVDEENEYILLSPDAAPPDLVNNPRFTYLETPIPGFASRKATTEKLVWEQYSAPSAARKVKVDLFHVPYFAPPYISRVPSVITIHDVIPLRLPVYQSSPRMRAYLQLVSRAANKASLIIAVSQHAKQDMMDALRLPAERIRVIYEAAGEEYRPVTDPDTLAKARARYGVGERYIFYLGGLELRKNVPMLVRAFAHLYQQLNDPGLQLLIAGNPDKKTGPLDRKSTRLNSSH